MYTVTLNKHIIMLRGFIVSSILACVFIFYIRYESENAILWFISALLLLLAYNAIRVLVPAFSITSQFDFSENIVEESIQKICFYRNGYKGQQNQYNYSVVNYFLGKDGINKLIIYHNDRVMKYYIFITDERNLKILDNWVERLPQSRVIKYNGIPV